MIKKILSIGLLFIIGLSLSACTEKEIITLNVDVTSITIIEGEKYQIAWDTNDVEGIDFSSGDGSVLTVTPTGFVTALSEGETTIIMRSLTDETVSVTISVIVRKLITLTSEDENIILKEEDTHLVVISSNDEYVYSSSNLNIFVVDENGLITAKKEGNASLVVTSTYDDMYEVVIPVTVEKLVICTLTQDNIVMVVGDKTLIDITANDDLVFSSRNPDIAIVDDLGNIEALKYGNATILITSVTDNNVSVELNVTVFKYTEEIEIDGNNILINGMSALLTISSSPVGAYTGVIWESNNPDIVTIDNLGNITGINVGIATIIAKSKLDDTIVDTYDIEVINVSVVDQSKTTGDTYSYMGVDLVYGERLFENINDALSSSPVGTAIYIASGTYIEDITITEHGYSLIGADEDVTIIGDLTIIGNDFLVQNIIFQGDSSITTTNVSNFMFKDNTVDNITTTAPAFLNLNTSNGAIISGNTFTTLNGNAINILDFRNGLFLIENNVISSVDTAINIEALEEYNIVTEINIIRNDIDTVTTGILIDLLYGTSQKQIEAIVRFNAVSNFTTGVISNIGNQVDFTLNYWGCVTVDYNKFVNIEESMLRGYYTLKEHIISEEDYNPDLPVLITVTNPITEIMIGETHTIEYDVLPMELESPYIKFITSDPTVLAVNQLGEITPLISGTATITVRSGYNSSIKTTTTIIVNTTPGIELTTSNVMNDLIVGDSFVLSASPFPLTYENASVSFSSSDETIATIDSNGNVNTLREGVVTFTASLDSDPSVITEYTISVYDTLDLSNLLDYLTSEQVSYSTSHSWIAYGFAYNYNDTRYESVSRYYFGDIVINDTKILPVGASNRPGLMTALASGVPPFNEDNIYWVVVHDTASTGTGSGALAHANWLYNDAMSANPSVNVSWHYTVDDTYIYQHLPEIERGYHAGDGSSLALQGTTYLGGGNRNGIGIEMAVNDDGDMYRTWQRAAKLVVDILVRHNMPITQQKYHNDFSGKDCPNTLRNAGLTWLFEEFVKVEFDVKTTHPNAEITFITNNPEYLDNHGRIIAMPQRAMTVSYTITVFEDGVTNSRTFYTYLPGTVH